MEYLLFYWPDSQDYMGEPWFRDEAILMNDERHLDNMGSSAYFIPKELIDDCGDDCSNEYILIEWPESQDYLDNEECIFADESSVFVPKKLV